MISIIVPCLVLFAILSQGILSIITRREGDYLNMGRHAMWAVVNMAAGILTIPTLHIFMIVGVVFLFIYMIAMYHLPKE
jgi:hypothetical protein